MPLLRKYTDDTTLKLNEQQAREIILDAMRVLFYSDAYTTNKYLIGTITKDKGARVEGPFHLESNWETANLIKGHQ